MLLAAEQVIEANPWVVVVGAVVTGICSVLVASLQLSGRKTADKRHDENRTVLNEIRTDLSEVRADVHEIRTKQSDHGERIARLEERTRTYPPLTGGPPFGPGGQS
jgi:hypothetical protein